MLGPWPGKTLILPKMLPAGDIWRNQHSRSTKKTKINDHKTIFLNLDFQITGIICAPYSK
jgi:hypothetical protein